MNQLQKRLNSLYSQKELIEQEILTLEAQLQTASQKKLTKNEKIQLFRELFVSREDIYVKEWISQDKSRQAFYPVTATFKKEDYIPLSNEAIENHLRGKEFIGSYLISSQNRSKYIVLKILEKDRLSLLNRIKSLNIKGYLQKDANGDLLVWIFFEHDIQAKNAKAFAQYLLRYSNISAKIYPNQEFVNSSKLGDYIPLPLHLKHRDEGKTIFYDFEKLTPFEDQWQFLNTVEKLQPEFIKSLLQKDKVDAFNETVLEQIEFPNFELKLFVYDFVYIPLENLKASFINRLKSMASFDNPQIKTLLALRKPLYNTPKLIRSYEEDETYLKLPRGMVKEILTLLEGNSVEYELLDKTFYQEEQFDKVTYTLREEQAMAIEAIMQENFSICVAPPGFGKTLIGAKMIELRHANTLVIVNKNMLLDQWRERFEDYFQMDKKEVGFLGKSKNKLNGRLDVATMQSLKNAPETIKNYSFVIVDECHHIPAVTFEQIIKEFHGRYILGLSATPNRKDGFEPILFQQLGDIAYEYKKKRTITHHLKLVKSEFTSTLENYSQIINELCVDEKRNALIVDQIKENRDRKILVLTDRIEHIKQLEDNLIRDNINYVTIHGSLSKKEQSLNMSKVETSDLILATTSFFGEGIDFPHLNTIIFATPISYYGRLVQYLGRVGRNGQSCLAIDILDSKNGILNSAYKKRAQGYKQMHYKII